MKHKSEARTLLIHFIQMVANQFSKSIKVIRSDNGSEFKIPEFYSSKGIIHQTSCVNTPQQNGVAERKHRHLLNVARALLFQATLPKHFWGDAILTAAYLINRTPTPLLKGKTPFECLFHTKPSYSHLKVFGCQCFVSTHPTHPSKFDPRAHECVFIGYPHGQKGYKLYLLTTKNIRVSRYVIFFEHVFPFQPSPVLTSRSHSPKLIPTISHTPSMHISILILYPPTSQSSAVPYSHHPILSPDLIFSPPTDNNPSIPSAYNNTPDPPLPLIPSPLPTQPLPPNPRRSSRATKLPTTLQGFHIDAALPSRPDRSDSSTEVLSPGQAHSLSNVLSYANLSSPYRTFTANMTIPREPLSFSQALQDPKWRDVMQQEVQALHANKTWSFVPPPAHKRPIGCKWVFKIKYNPNGTIERYKAKLVAKRFSQVEGIDYWETFAPVAKLTTVRILLSLAAMQNWHLHQLDINNAFLNGDLDEDVYMQLPPGFRRKGEHRVCKLHKSLYGLKQASRQWFLKLSSALKSVGLTQSWSDYSLFV